MPLGSGAANPQIKRGYDLLYKGDYLRSLPLLEHRIPNKFPLPRGVVTPYSKAMIWHPGVSVKGVNLVVLPENGRGDIIHYMRYIKLLPQLGVKSVHVVCYPEMLGLVGRLGFPVGTKPPADVQEPCIKIYIMSIPALLLEHKLFPEQWTDKHYLSEGYLRNEQISDKSEAIGLCWYTNSDAWNAKYRQIPTTVVQKLVKKYPKQEFVSLQMEDTFLTSVLKCGSMAGSADEIQKLKAVVSIDTSILHLCGALGVPTYGLVGNAAWLDWRWLPKQEETAWYDSVRCVYNEPYDNWEAAMSYALDKVCR